MAALLVVFAAGKLPAQEAASAPPASAGPEILDRVIAVVNGDVLLESDLEEEMRFAVLQPYIVPQGQNTPRRALGRLINRSLILQQMKEQQTLSPVPRQDIQQRLDESRKTLPLCAQYHCQTESGWQRFLGDNGLTEAEVTDRTGRQLLILKFIELRFRAGIRVSQAEIQEFYQRTFLPQFEKSRQPPPAIASVTSRIEEILLQQKVNVLLQDWLKSLRAQGSVQILDPAYAQDSDPDADAGGAE